MFAMLMKWMKANKVLPQISDTERQALEAGSVWIDGGFFAGKPDFKKILAENYNKLSHEEQAFVDGPVEELCRMIDRHEIARTKRIPDQVTDFIKTSGMMGFLVPKQYGGLQFSTLAISTILHKVAPVNAAVSMYLIIPSSLGAAELIIHYGTKEQKESYLPKLASGEYLPCFGLTEPTAGSDAASIKAEGLVFRDGSGEINIKLNFRKRYITLAPIANLATIACQLHDPENLLGKGEHPGITCVLVHKGTPGFINGDHHDPIGDPFYNGPLIGKDVIVPIKNVIGGDSGVGQGWRMLMEQLAGGRMVSLPASAVGGAKAAAAHAGAYSIVRQQFGISIGRMEGVEDKIGKIAALTYMIDGARIFGCSAVDNGVQPPVVSAIMKAYTTDIARELVTDSMDVFSGSGIMQGPNNIQGRGYMSAPVAITVEGANIMTRTLMIFGQGATRCHPYALKVVKGVEDNNVALFRASLVGWIAHFIFNILRSVVQYLTRGLTAGSPVSGPTARYYRMLSWSATRFAILTDLAMFTIGGKLKVRGNLTGRYSDALAWMILATGALRRFEAEGRISEDLPLVHYSVQYALNKVQEAFSGIYANFGRGVLGWWLRNFSAFLLRLNPIGRPPSDQLRHQAALAIQSPNDQYRRLTNDAFMAPADKPGAGRLLKAFRLVHVAAPAVRKIQAGQKAGKLPRGIPEEHAQLAAQLNLITVEEVNLVQRAYAARLEAIEVDVITADEFFGNHDKADVAPNVEEVLLRDAKVVIGQVSRAAVNQ